MFNQDPMEKEPNSITEIIKRFVQKAPEAAGRLAGKKRVEAAAAQEELFRRVREALKKENSKVAERNIEHAEQLTKDLRSRDRTKVSKAEEVLQKQAFANRPLEKGKQILQDLMQNANISRDVPDWLKSTTEIRFSTTAAELVTNAIYLPPDLRDNPYVLYEIVRTADASFDFKSATNEAIAEYVQVRLAFIRHIQERIQQLVITDTKMGDIFADLENDGVFGEKFDLYRSKKLEEVVPPGRKPAKKDRMTAEERQEYHQQMEEWIERNIPALQRRDLDSDLQAWQDNIDAGRYLDKRDEDGELRNIANRLKNGKETRSKTEEGITIRRSSYNPKEADEYLDKIYQRRRILEAQIKVERAALEQELQQQREEAHREQRESDFSSIYLSPFEVDQIIKNPAVFFEPKLRELEASASDVSGKYFESQMRRLELAGEMFGSDFFDRQRLSKDMTIVDINRLVERFNGMDKVMKRRLSQYVSTRIDILYANYMLTYTTDTKRFAERMQAISDRGILLMAAADGGLVGDWAGRYEQILKGLVKKSTRLYTPQEAEATNIAVQQLLAERDLYKDSYMNFFKDYQLTGTELPKQFCFIDQNAAESIIRRAKTTWRLRMRKPVVMEQGLGPGAGEWETGFASYATLSIEEKMLGAARIRDWFMRKWGPKREFLLVWNTGAYFTAKADRKLWPHVQKQTDDLWEALHLPETTKNAVTRKQALGQLATLLRFNEPYPSVQDLKPPSIEGFEVPVIARLQKMKRRDLERLIALEEGGFRMQRLLRPYFYMDSLWRDSVFRTYIEKAYTHGDKMFLGARLRSKGEAHFFSPITADHHKAEQDLINELLYVAKYRPQGIADFLRRGDDTELNQWFDLNKTAFGVTEMDKMFDQINRWFLMINQMIIHDNGEPIDYSETGSLLRLAGLTSEERTAIFEQPQNARLKTWWKYVEKAFSIRDDSAEINTPQQYLTTMESVYTHLTENSNAQIHKLTGVQYDRCFLHIPWEDDIPAHLLQDPKNMVNINSAYKEAAGLDMDGNPLPISHLLTDQGAGPGSPLLRAWNDYLLAMETFDAVNQFNFSPDEKKFVELMNLVYNNICVYQGPYLGSEAVIKLTAAWLGSAQVKARYGELFTGMLDSSVFKEARGPEAPSLSLDKVYEVLEEMQKNVTRLDAQAPHMMHELERFLRIANVHIFGRETPISWHSVFTLAEKAPILRSIISPQLISRIERGYPMGLWTYKVMLAAAFVAVVIALTTGSEIKRGGKEEPHR